MPMPVSWRDLFAKILPRQAIDPGSLPVGGRMPEFDGATVWLNSPPLDTSDLAGKVVLVDFWTYSCVNCLRSIPALKAWQETYQRSGLVVIGVHTPEFEFEKDPEGVRKAVARHGIKYPVALDNDYILWNRYRNHYWPAHYFIDARGNIRYHHFGEGDYGHSEAVLRSLLAEKGAHLEKEAAPRIRPVAHEKIGTPETYLGFDRLEYLGSPESVRPGVGQNFTSVRDPASNVFYLNGVWQIDNEYALPLESGAGIIFRVSASQVNLVMKGGTAVQRVKIMLDGMPLTQANRGTDVVADDASVVSVDEGRMYNLIDTPDDYSDKLLELTFLDPGVQVYVFTFG